MIAAFMLVYIVLVAQFNSYKQPFTIALSLPLGLVGAVIGLWVTGYPFGFMALLGVSGRVAWRGVLIEGVTIRAYKSIAALVAGEVVAASQPTATDGTYQLDLPPGRYSAWRIVSRQGCPSCPDSLRASRVRYPSARAQTRWGPGPRPSNENAPCSSVRDLR